MDEAVSKLSKWIGAHCYAVALFLFLALMTIYHSNRNNMHAGDTRALTDLAWWVSFVHMPRLNGVYPDDPKAFGYWARKLDSGLIAIVASPGTALLAAPYETFLRFMGAPMSVEIAPMYGKTAASIMTSITAVCLFLLLGKSVDWLTALVIAVFAGVGSAYHSILAQAIWSQTGGVFCQAVSSLMLYPVLRASQQWRSQFLLPPKQSALLLVGGFFAAYATGCRPTFFFWTLAYSVLCVAMLRRASLAALIGLMGGTAVVLWLNKTAQGSITGGHVQLAQEIGFSFAPKFLMTNFLAGFLSPYRGLFAWSPWLLLSLPGLRLIGSRKTGRDGWYAAHIFFLLTNVVALLTYNDLWTWESGARHPVDMVFSCCVLAAPTILFLLRKPLGMALVAALGLPAMYAYQQAAREPYYRGDYDALPAYAKLKVKQEPMSWKYSTLRYFMTDAEAERDMRDEKGEPLWDTPVLDMAPKNVWRFIQKGIRPDRNALRLHRKEGVLLFRLPPGTDNVAQTLEMALGDPPMTFPAEPKWVKIYVNEHLVHVENWSGGGNRRFQVIIPPDYLNSGGINRLTICDPQWRISTWGPARIYVSGIAISPR